jgi:hypothetical protein
MQRLRELSPIIENINKLGSTKRYGLNFTGVCPNS